MEIQGKFSCRGASGREFSLLIAALTLVGLLVAPQVRAEHYGAAQNLSEAGQDAYRPQIAIDSADRATITWQRSDGSHNRIQSVRLAADGTPGAVQTLSEAGQKAESPQIAIDSADRATITWRRYDGSSYRIQSVRLAADGTLETVQTLSEAGQSADSPQIAIDSADRATITWRRSEGSRLRIQSVRLASDGTPGPVQNLSAVTGAGQRSSNPQIAIDSLGRATITWRNSDGYGLEYRIQSVRLAADGTPGPLQTLSGAGESAYAPQIAIDSADRATITWYRDDGSNKHNIQSVRLAADGTPGTVQTLSEAGQDAITPQIAIDSTDRATVTWYRFLDGSNYYIARIQSVRLAADGTPGTVQAVSADGEGTGQPQIAIDSSDRATIAWYSGDGTNTRIRSVRLGADGTPGSVQTLSEAGAPGLNPQIAIDSSDRPTITWRRGSGSDWLIQSTASASAPPSPTLDSTNPSSPANENTPELIGTAVADSTVEIFTSPDCSGVPAATGTAGEFADPGIEVSVPDDSTTSFYASATDAGGHISECSSPITYTEDSAAPPAARITRGKGNPTRSTEARTHFDGGGPGFTAECQLDRGRWSPCTSPHAVTGLPDGFHALRVRWVTPSGASGPSDSHVWRVDTVDPTGYEVLAANPQRQSGRRVAVDVEVALTEALHVGVTGAVNFSGRGFKLKPRRLHFGPDATRTFRMRLLRDANNAGVFRAIRRGEKVTAELRIKLRDAAGNVSIEARTVKLK